MNNKLKTKSLDMLFNGILSLKSVEECYNFFEDLCTISELKAMAQRLEVAVLLNQGQTYTEVEAVTGASSTTISRVNKCLENGADGYKAMINSFMEE